MSTPETSPRRFGADEAQGDRERFSALIVDDDEGARVVLAQALEEAGVEVLEATDGETGWVTLVRRAPELVVTHWRAPRVDGAQLLARIHKDARAVLVVAIVARNAKEERLRAKAKGAWDIIDKPLEGASLQAVLRRAVAYIRLSLSRRRLEAELALARYCVFRSAPMSALAARVAHVARGDLAVLISGAPGTGKELVARALVASSRRAEGPSLRFNCAVAGQAEQTQAELFGRSRGRGEKARVGLLREAEGGSLFLDEVAELDLSSQRRLRSVLRDGELLPLGASRSTPIDVRIVASTHRDLRSLVAHGRFDEDLYRYLKVTEVRVPSLAERIEDIAPLTDYFLRCHAERLDVEVPRLGGDLRRRLRELPWPGNIRELRATLERLVVIGRGGELSLADLDRALSEAPRDVGLRDRVASYERAQIIEELERSGGNRTVAARRLHLSRGTLMSKMKKYGLS